MNRYRTLKGLARNLADKFLHSCEHFAYLAISSGTEQVVIDLMAQIITPAPFVSERNQILVNMCHRDLDSHMKRIPPGTIRSVELLAPFQKNLVEQSISSLISVSITDDKRRIWSASTINNNQTISK